MSTSINPPPRLPLSGGNHQRGCVAVSGVVKLPAAPPSACRPCAPTETTSKKCGGEHAAAVAKGAIATSLAPPAAIRITLASTGPAGSSIYTAAASTSMSKPCAWRPLSGAGGTA